MKPTMQVTFDNNETWEVDLTIIYWERAKYYVDLDLKDGDITVDQYAHRLQEEFKHACTDEYDGFDWIKNNCDWDDLKPHAKLLFRSDSDYPYAEKFNSAKMIHTHDYEDK